MPAILSRLSILFTNYALRDLDKHKNTFIQTFLSVPGCQTCMCKRCIRVRAGVSGNTFSIKRTFEQV